MDQGIATLGRRGEKTTREDFPILKFLFLFDFPNRWNNNFYGDIFEYLPQLLY
jgi:hypothetical protein